MKKKVTGLDSTNQQTQGPIKKITQKVAPELSRKIKANFLVFRPYEDPISIRPYPPQDRGYYFYLHNCDIKIIRYTLEDNGFRDIKANHGDSYKLNDGKWTVYWSVGVIKKAIYESLHKYQKVNHFPCSFYMTRKDLMYK